MSVVASRRIRRQPSPVLTAACDAMALSTLSVLGKRVVRSDRSRYKELGTREPRPYHLAHVVWSVPETQVDAVLRGAWTHVPAVVQGHCPEVDPSRVVQALDSYIRDTVSAHAPHSVGRLQEVMGEWL